MMSQSLSQRLAVVALKARDPNTLTLEQGYEIYRADLVRELRAADDAFRGVRRTRLSAATGAFAFHTALLLTVLSALAFAAPVRRICEAWAVDARGPMLLLTATVAAAALLINRRLGPQAG